jgi:IMP dehydrogenase
MYTLGVEEVVRSFLTFDDVLLVPRHAQNVQSRLDPDPRTKLGKIELKTPIISANMSTVTEVSMMAAMSECGALGIMHRFLSVEQQVENVKEAHRLGIKDVAVSIGAGPSAEDDAHLLAESGANIFCIDVAHGDSAKVVQLLNKLRSSLSGATLIGGNVATPGGALRLADAGADIVKVGIGPGSVCSTRAVAGCGVPQLTAVASCAGALLKSGLKTSIIADGGIRTSGDIVKALAVGAHAVMIGRLFAGTDEAPVKDRYFGMASESTGRVRQGVAAEGVTTTVQNQGPVRYIIDKLYAGIQTGMSYQDALTIADLQSDPQFVRVTNAGIAESGVRF